MFFSADKAEILDAIEKDDDGQRLTNFLSYCISKND